MATRYYDSVEFLTDEEEIAAYLKAAAEHNDGAFYTECLAKVARARAINHLAERTGIDRQQILELMTEPKNIMQTEEMLEWIKVKLHVNSRCLQHVYLHWR